MQPDKMEALIHRRIEHVDISLENIKKTIFKKVCTLIIFGLHAIAKWKSRENCVVAAVRSEIVVGDRCRGRKVAQIASEKINGTNLTEVSFRCSGT